jgi:chromosome segregation ATPase
MDNYLYYSVGDDDRRLYPGSEDEKRAQKSMQSLERQVRDLGTTLHASELKAKASTGALALAAEKAQKTIHSLEEQVSFLKTTLHASELKVKANARALAIAEEKVAITDFVLKEVSRLRISTGEECTICLEPFTTCITFRCGHSFCKPCAAQLQGKCAICRLKSS